MRNILLLITIGLFTLSCKQSVKENGTANEPKENAEARARGIYHWKGAFDLSQEDTEFISRHNIKRVYVRMFDVGMEVNESNDSLEVVPLGTTRFKSKIPKGCELIPTVYITQEALKAFSCKEWKLAELIVTRVKAMVSWNELGGFTELQYDCDWTTETRKSFEKLCTSTKKILDPDGVCLSGTIRLHQLEEATYPFDRGVLMIYNTGSFVNPNTKNSILDYNDVKKYLAVDERIRKFKDSRKTNCQVIDIAYPTFNWGVVFGETDNFKRLVKDISSYTLHEGESIRIEKSEYQEVIKVKHLVDSLLNPITSSNIIYHLDSNNLKSYSSEQIENIYN